MHERNWREDAVTGLAAVAAVALGLSIAWDLSALRSSQRVSEYYDRQRQQTDTDDEIAELCAGLPDLARVQCLIDAVETRHQWDAERRDHHAQEEAALWAKWSALATIAAALAAIFGIFLIRRTWVEAKRTADLTREIGEAQVRAYLSVQEVMISLRPGQIHPVIKLKVGNCGQSPARRLKVVAEFNFSADHRKVQPFVLEPQVGIMWLRNIAAGGDVTSLEMGLGDVKMDMGLLGDALENLVGIHINLAIFGYDVFGKEIVVTGTFSVAWLPSEDKGVLKLMHDFSDIDVARHMIDKLRPEDRKPRNQ